MERDLYGFGGWLILFTIGLGVLTPLVEIASVYPMLYGADSIFFQAQIESWSLFRTIFTLFIAGEIALFVYTCYRLIKVYNPETVRITRIVIWVSALVLPALGIFILAQFLGMPFGDLFAASFEESPFELVRPLIWAGIWTAYFSMSERVRQTYLEPRDGGTAEVFT